MKRPDLRVRRALGALAVAAALAAVVTVGVRPTSASWVSAARLGQSVAVASADCTSAGVYRTTAAARFLAGSAAGVPLAGSTALAALTASNPATSATFSSGAIPQGGDGATSTVSNASLTSALQAAGGVAALVAPSGSQTQYAAATSTGTSVAGAGAITASGAVDIAGITAGTRAGVGSVDISGVLAQVPGGTAAAGALSRLGLSIGTAASTERLDECARRWGAPLSRALSRTATVSGLSLGTKDAALTTLLGSVSAQRSTVAAAFAQVGGTEATSSAAAACLTTAKGGLVSAVGSALSTLGLAGTPGTSTGTVSITASAAGADTAAAESTTGGSGLIALDGSSGAVSVDLSKLADTASPAPNTAVLTTTATDAIASGVGAAAGSLVSDVGSAWDASASGTLITVDVAVPVIVAGTTALTVQQHLQGTVAQFASGSTVWPAPTVTVVGGLVGLDPNALVSTLVPRVRAQLVTPLQTTIAAAVTSPLTSAASGARSALASALTAARSALPVEFGRLASLLSITLDEQPDVSPFPTAAAGTGGGFVTTALRVHVVVAGADELDLAVANASVGPDRTINQ